MPARTLDAALLAGLLLIDVINDLEFPEGTNSCATLWKDQQPCVYPKPRSRKLLSTPISTFETGLRQLLKQHELTPDLRHLRSSLVATCKIMDTRFPEFDVWQENARNDAKEDQKKMQELHQMAYEAGGDLGLLVQKMKAKLAQEQMASPGQSPARYSRLAQRPPRSQERRPGLSSSERAKVGRNDPCPCGSGRKFKNCCMKKQGGFL